MFPFDHPSALRQWANFYGPLIQRAILLTLTSYPKPKAIARIISAILQGLFAALRDPGMAYASQLRLSIVPRGTLLLVLAHVA
jgi:hypothetical protein